MRLLHSRHGDELRGAAPRNPNPSLDDVKAAISGHLCRCGTYPHVFAATLAAAKAKKADHGTH